jgi:hypothetical protein
VMVMKTDSMGQMVSQRSYGGNGAESANVIRATADGNYVVAGGTHSFGAGGEDAYLLKVNSNGDTLWTKTYGLAGDEAFSDLVCLPDGSMLGVGSSSSFTDSLIYLVRIDAEGNELWTRHVGGIPGESGNALTTAHQGGFLIAGQITDESMFTSDGYLVRVDADGGQLWSCRYHRNDIVWFDAVVQTDDDAFIMGGSADETHGSFSSNDWFLLKTGPDPVLDVPQLSATLPAQYALSVYPNPFNATTTLALELPQAGPVTVTLVDALGRQAQQYAFPQLSAGRHDIRVDGSHIASGVYFAQVTAGTFRVTQKLALIK